MAIGVSALFSNTTGNDNTAAGFGTLESNTTGSNNTAVGFEALFSNTTGSNNTANGLSTLLSNTTGNNNTASGFEALVSNTTGINNTATGFNALLNNTIGRNNTADGLQALNNNTMGINNAGVGVNALFSNTTGNLNVALGVNAMLRNTTGSSNIALGVRRSRAASFMANAYVFPGGRVDTADAEPGEALATRVCAAREVLEEVGVRLPSPAALPLFSRWISGVAVTGSSVVINASGQLGVAASSERFKDEIKRMDKASDAVLALQPVTFRYKKNIDPDGVRQFGLVAEEVAKVNPDLVARDAKGEVYTVRYEAVNAMLLNEFLKEHRKNEEQEKTIAELKSGLTALADMVKAQASQIQQVSAQFATASPSRRGLRTSTFAARRIRASGPAPQLVNNP